MTRYQYVRLVIGRTGIFVSVLLLLEIVVLVAGFYVLLH